MRKCALWLVPLLLIVPQSLAQVFRGAVTDAVSGESLPSATVQVLGTYRGTITSEEGLYELRVDAVPVTLVVRFIGYETATRTLTAVDPVLQNFSLLPLPVEMAALTVTGENPAVNIMREVIARKRVWRGGLRTYEAQAYSRFSLSGDSSIVWVSESASTAFWDRDRGMKERITGNRSTSNPWASDAVMPVAQTVANLYDDNVFIAGHNLVGVTHPDALGTYRFVLEGTRVLDGLTVYDIQVAPRNRLASAFEGRVSVLDSAFAMISAELTPGESFLFPQPIQEYDVTYRQQFSSFGGEYWMPVDFQSAIVAKVSMPGILTYPRFNISHVARFSDYRINTTIPEDLFADDKPIVVDSAAVESGEVFGEPGLVVPLTSEEQAAYDNPDIGDDLVETFTPGGLLGRLMQRYGEGPGSGRAETDSSDNGRRALFSNLLRPGIWYNRVDGAHLGLGLAADLGSRVTVGGGGGWASGLTGQDRWTWHVTAGVESEGTNSVFLRGRAGSRTARRYGEKSKIPPLYNGLVMLSGREDHFDYYHSEGWELTAGLNLSRLDMRLEGTYRSEDHRALPMTTSYDLLARPPLQGNPAIKAGHLESLTATVAIGSRAFLAGSRGNRALNVTAEFSLPASDYDFWRYEVDATWRQPTIGRRRLLPAILDLRFKAGYGSSALPLQRAFMVDSSVGSYAGPGMLRSVGGRPFEGDDMIAFFWAHNFRTMPFEMLKLRSLVKGGYSIILFGGHATTWLPDVDFPDADADAIRRLGTRGIYHELGFSLAGIMGWLRLDVAAGLGRSSVRMGLGAYSPF